MPGPACRAWGNLKDDEFLNLCFRTAFELYKIHTRPEAAKIKGAGDPCILCIELLPVTDDACHIRNAQNGR